MWRKIVISRITRGIKFCCDEGIFIFIENNNSVIINKLNTYYNCKSDKYRWDMGRQGWDMDVALFIKADYQNFFFNQFGDSVERKTYGIGLVSVLST